jgi:NADH dehydrogenase
MAAASLGIPIWGITSVILLPLLSGNQMAWDAVGMQGHFAPLVGWILFGALLGGILQIASEIAEIRYGPETAPVLSPSVNLPRVVILGGGFGGMKAAEYLEEQLGGSVSISLVSDTNALLFTPMLAEVPGVAWSLATSACRCVAASAGPSLCAAVSPAWISGEESSFLMRREQRAANWDTIT